MAWKMDNPFYSMADEEENRKSIELWEAEKPGGLWEGNNRLPYPIVWLCALIILTAFMITMPIWGQRPTAELYAPMVELMDTPEVQRLATGPEKIAYLTDRAMESHKGAEDPRLTGLLDRHPISWNDLQLAAPGIREIAAGGGGTYGLESFNVIGDQVVLANFTGKIRPDGKRERVQPWFDKGFVIDLFYVTYFVIVMVIVIKRMPPYTTKPDMTKSA